VDCRTRLGGIEFGGGGGKWIVVSKRHRSINNQFFRKTMVEINEKNWYLLKQCLFVSIFYFCKI
jgi:hypothetical protein